eukprot:3577146-Amphidinium_carterae.1
MDLPRLHPVQVSNLIFAIGMLEAHQHADLVRDLVARFRDEEGPRTLTALADVAWTLCSLDMVRELNEDFQQIMEDVFSKPPPQNRVPLVKIFDVLCALELEYKDVSVTVPATWKAA